MNRSNEEAFYEELEDSQGVDGAVVVKEIQEWAQHDKPPRFEWRSTGRRETFEPCSDYKGPHFPLRIGTDGKVTINFQFLKGPFGKEEKRKELLQRLNEISGVDISADRINGQLSFPLSVLKDEAALKQFREVLDWFVQEVEAT